MKWIFLDVAAVQNLHKQQIDLYGGSHGLRDAGLLESAVLRAENKVNYEPDAPLASVAATLGWGLIKNHAFVDGNKRIGLVSTVVFLNINGYDLVAEEAEELEMVRRVAASEASEEDWSSWLEQHMEKSS